MPADDIRGLLEAVEPTSILPATAKPPADPLAAIFSVRDKVYYVGDRVPAWWTPERDKWLWRTMMASDVLSGAVFSTSARLASIPLTIVPRDRTNRNHRRLARWAGTLLEYYWMEAAFQIAMEWQTQDNGFFVEILGAGDPGGPIEPTRIPGTQDYLYGLGLNVLDSQYCTRTGDPTYPVLYRYRPPAGPEKLYKFHRSRIVFSSQMPQPRRDMFNVGLSAASRSINRILRLGDIDYLMDEILGSRPISQIVFSRGISAEQMQDSFEDVEAKRLVASQTGDNRRSSQTVFISAEGAPEAIKAASIETFDLKRFPDGFNEETAWNLAMNIIAMDFGFDAREFWPATVRGATRADAEVQAEKAKGKTPGYWMTTIAQELARHFAPNVTRPEFDQQDDSQDMQRAEIRRLRAEVVKTYMDAGVLDTDVSWQMMMEEGDISEEQYAMLKRSEEFALRAEMARQQAEILRQEALNAGKEPSSGDDSSGRSSGSSGGGGGGGM